MRPVFHTQPSSGTVIRQLNQGTPAVAPLSDFLSGIGLDAEGLIALADEFITPADCEMLQPKGVYPRTSVLSSIIEMARLFMVKTPDKVQKHLLPLVIRVSRANAARRSMMSSNSHPIPYRHAMIVSFFGSKTLVDNITELCSGEQPDFVSAQTLVSQHVSGFETSLLSLSSPVQLVLNNLAG